MKIYIIDILFFFKDVHLCVCVRENMCIIKSWGISFNRLPP